MPNPKPNRARARAAKRLSNAAKVGMAPGALIHLGERKTEQAAFRARSINKSDGWGG